MSSKTSYWKRPLELSKHPDELVLAPSLGGATTDDFLSEALTHLRSHIKHEYSKSKRRHPWFKISLRLEGCRATDSGIIAVFAELRKRFQQAVRAPAGYSSSTLRPLLIPPSLATPPYAGLHPSRTSNAPPAPPSPPSPLPSPLLHLPFFRISSSSILLS
eukprot:761267-Hanusia_phi.AAC.1